MGKNALRLPMGSRGNVLAPETESGRDAGDQEQQMVAFRKRTDSGSGAAKRQGRKLEQAYKNYMIIFFNTHILRLYIMPVAVLWDSSHHASLCERITEVAMITKILGLPPTLQRFRRSPSSCYLRK